MQPNASYVPWRERLYLTIPETAQVFARSGDWVRSRVSRGDLEGVRRVAGAPLVVTVRSILSFAECMERVERAEPPVKAGRPRLALVVDNAAGPKR